MSVTPGVYRLADAGQRGGELTIERVAGSQITFSLATTTPSGITTQLCSLERARATLSGNTAVFDYLGRGGSCRLSLQFEGQRIKISQSGQCGFCGVSGRVDGTYVRQAAPTAQPGRLGL